MRRLRYFKQDIQAVLIVAVFYILLHILNIGCPIKFITGISCAGCGMTRAWISVLKLDFTQAFHFHPLFWIIPPIGIFFFFKERLSPKTARFIMCSLVMLFTTVYIIRMISPEDTVVKIELYESVVWRFLERMREIIE